MIKNTKYRTYRRVSLNKSTHSLVFLYGFSYATSSSLLLPPPPPPPHNTQSGSWPPKDVRCSYQLLAIDSTWIRYPIFASTDIRNLFFTSSLFQQFLPQKFVNRILVHWKYSSLKKSLLRFKRKPLNTISRFAYPLNFLDRRNGVTTVSSCIFLPSHQPANSFDFENWNLVWEPLPKDTHFRNPFVNGIWPAEH